MTTLTKVIGKTIWLLTDNAGNGIYRIDKSQKRLVVGVVECGHNLPDGSINDDWCEHLIIQNEDGTISDVKEYCCIICPEENLDEVSMVNKYLSDNGIWPDEVWDNDKDSFGVKIEWGDWKHDHGWCDDLMEYLGYCCGDVVVTEENGSDCYSAIHYYYKVEE